jgi:primosomal protein N'
VTQNPEGDLECPQCGLTRPVVCASCGSTVLKQLRIGVARAKEELEAVAGRPVGEVTASTKELPGEDVLVGTEALLPDRSRTQ